MAQEGLGLNMGRLLVVLYSNNSMVGAQNSSWLHNALKILISLFWYYRIVGNVGKLQTMMFQPKALRSVMLEEAVGWRYTGVGASNREILWRCISCLECSIKLTSGSMSVHRIWMNWTEPEINQNRLPVSQMENLPKLYITSSPKITTQ